MRRKEEEAKQVLGSCCARCGIEHPLQWDHINNDPQRRSGAAKRSSTFQTEYAEISKIARGEGSTRLQLLCPNCNWLKAYDPVSYLEQPAYGPTESRYKIR